ncbi:T9SS sorting signal type C domain-containing protein [Flavobacterium piscis]|uniref:Repeat protein (TIGR01451 family) n=1 Tax=Flavobacterium piscis TaxID=1114874 RepID=A0ABU1Y7P9_9FLAO|nr:T9SS sorting signal type C domain-containing protein [Flavobacterium piscis]MDR7209516.1 putative repeat protein (TIGR01451 family) [Flavobacterium piscis]
MFQKSFLFVRSLFLKTLGILFFLVAPKVWSQTSVTRIYTDWNGYWTSNSATGTNNQPNTENNLLAFNWGGKTYATGANNEVLSAHSVAFEDSRFRALKIQSLEYTTNTYFLQGSFIDGSLTDRILTPPLSGSLSVPAELASRLTDGINGLALGTGIANIKTGSSVFKIGTDNLRLDGIGDGIPDLLVSQVAEPNSTVDTFRFLDSSNNIVGNVVNVAFNSIQVVGTYRLDLFNANNGTPASSFAANATRDIRLLALDLSAFGITAATAAQVDRFVVSFSGNSDCAFIAFNTNSLKIAQLSLVKKASLTGCGKLGDIINYTFEVTNTGEVPITDIYVTDLLPGMVITGNPVSSLAVGATTTLTGTYTITAGDVAAGRVVNSAKVAGIDPSLNIVEDISGNSNTDDIPTVTNLLAPPSVGTITNVTCSASGSVVLNNLPSGNWSLQRTPGGTTTTGSGTTTTINGLAANTYTFKVTDTDFGCTSPSSANVVVTEQSSTTWNGSAWSNGIPSTTKSAIIASVTPNSPFTADLTACALTINPSVIATVPSGVTLTIINAVTTNGQLIFENNSGLVQDPAAAVNMNTGNIIYRRISSPMKNFDFSYWSSPVSGQTLLNLSPNTLSDKYMSYSGTGWKQEVASTKIMTPGTGYIIRTPKAGIWGNGENVVFPYAQPVQFTGIPNNGDISGQSVVPGNFYLIGNPYPSALDANEFLSDNTILNGTIYFWTHNTAIQQNGPKYIYVSDDYAAYNQLGGVAATSGGQEPLGYVAAGQSFFGSALSSGTIAFKNNMRVGGNNSQFFKPAKTSKSAKLEKHRLWLNMTNSGGAFKQTLIGYVTGATNDYEGDFDGRSFDGNSFIDFYSVNNANKFVIQGRALPFKESDKVPLGFRSTLAGDFTISIDKADGVLADQRVFLEDKQTNTIHELTQNDYTFTTAKGTFNDRFVVKYVNVTLGTGDFETADDGVEVIVKNKNITISSEKENIDKVFIYDISGKQLYRKDKVSNGALIVHNLSVPQQVLLVKVVLENDNSTTKKVIFK